MPISTGTPSGGGGSGTVTSVTAADATIVVAGTATDPTIAAGVIVAPATHAAASKATPVDADELPVADSAASFGLKKLTWANLKATMKSYTDTLYPSGSGTSTGTNTGDQTSVSGNAGTATKLATARTIDGTSFDGTANVTVIAPGTDAAPSKATPVDGDELPLVDSAASFVLKKLTWANVKATLKTYFDTLYSAAGAPVVYASGVGASHTGDTAETIIATISIPAGQIGANGQVVIQAFFTRNTGGTSSVQAAFKFGAASSGTGGTAVVPLASILSTAQRTIMGYQEFANANAAATQKIGWVGSLASGPFNAANASAPQSDMAINTANASEINITGKCLNAGDTINLVYYRVVVYPHA